MWPEAGLWRMMGLMQVRISHSSDRPFLLEMARLACTLEDHPLPAGDDPEVLAILPAAPGAAVIATDDAGVPIGAPGGTCTPHPSFEMPEAGRYRKW